MRKWTKLITVLTMVFMFGGLSNADLNDGLVAYYPFNGNANDESGNGFHGSGLNGVSYLQGAAGSAVYFDGVDDRITTLLGVNGEIKFLDPFTVSYWIFDDVIGSNTVTNNGTIWGVSGPPLETANRKLHSGKRKNGEWNVAFIKTSVFQVEAAYVDDAFYDYYIEGKGWKHIVVSSTGGPRPSFKLFINGVEYTQLLRTLSKGDDIDDISSSDYFSFGALNYFDDPTLQYNVGVDEFRFYNRVLSVAEIHQLYGGSGDLKITIEPPGARDAGAQWRVDGSAWQNSGDTQSGLLSGQHIVEFKTITGWSRPGNQEITIIGDQTTGAVGTYIETDEQTGILEGMVTELDAQGDPVGSLSGALVELPGYGATNTDSQGAYRFSGVSPGTYTVAAGKTGYYSSTREISLGAGETKAEHFRLTAEQATAGPRQFDFASPDGKHFVPGMPGDINFATTVAWNGSPGSVRFWVAGEWQTATTTDLGGGRVRAELSVTVPGNIDTCSELTIEVTNGEGETNSVNMGVHYSPFFGVIPWYKDTFWWTPSGGSLFYSTEASYNWDITLPSDNLDLGAFAGYGLELKYDLFSATLSGSLDGNGGLDFAIPTPQPGLKILGAAGLGVTGRLAISLAGCDAPTVTPSWAVSGNGKAGVEAPVVLVLDAVAPGVGSTLASIPVINDIKLQLYLLAGGELNGVYEASQTGECLFGSTSNTGSLTGGLEAQARVKVLKAEAGIYVGGTGTYDVGLCPDLSFDGYTGRIYAGAFAKAFGFEQKREVGADISWGFTEAASPMARVMAITDLSQTDTGNTWQPIDKAPLKWGALNRLPIDGRLPSILSESLVQSGDSEEEMLLENVTWLAHPSVFSGGTGRVILYAQHDTDKPWYAVTDIAEVFQEGSDPWAMRRITDDLAAEFSPEIASVGADTLLGAWARVDGDVSGAQSPEEVVPYLEIVASFYDSNSSAWSSPVPLMDNDIVDRDPLPVFFGDNIGVVWIQNQGQAMPGNATLGDSLMYAGWNGSGWEAPVTIWSDQKGILDFSFVSDDQGEGHVVFAVDEDGDPESLTDQELYQGATQGGIWQEPVRLTNDLDQDALPVLVSPNGEPMLVWSLNSTLMYSYLNDWNPMAVYAQETLANKAPTLDGVTMPGGAAIAYSVQNAEGMDVVAAFYDTELDQWSLPRQLTRDEDAESSLSLAFDGSELVMAYLKTQTLREDIEVDLGGAMQTIENVPQPGRTDLYILRHALGHDLAVAPGSVVFEPSNPVPGTAAEIKTTIENRGNLPAQNITVTVYDGDPNVGGTQIGQTSIVDLIAGGSQKVTVSWDVPGDPNSHHVFVVVDPELSFDDRDRGNNTKSACTVLPDLKVQTGRSESLSETEVILTTKIVNDGVIPSGLFNVCWRLGSSDGETLGCKEILTIGAGGSREATLVWDQSIFTFQYGSETVYVIVDSEDVVSESEELNNSHFQAVLVNSALVDCECDFAPSDVDVDGLDLAAYIADSAGIRLDVFAADFGRTNCPSSD